MLRVRFLPRALREEDGMMGSDDEKYASIFVGALVAMETDQTTSEEDKERLAKHIKADFYQWLERHDARVLKESGEQQ